MHNLKGKGAPGSGMVLSSVFKVINRLRNGIKLGGGALAFNLSTLEEAGRSL